MGAIAALAMASATGGACGMSASTNVPVKCRVDGADKALAAAGGPQALCEAIEAAARAKAPKASFTVEIRALSTYSLAANIRLADGRDLPEQRMAVNDRRIDRGSIERFAAAIADQIASSLGS